MFDLFLGKGGVDKLLYGRDLEWDTIEEIEKIISEQIIPDLDVSMENIKNKIIKKYNVDKKDAEEIEVIK